MFSATYEPAELQERRKADSSEPIGWTDAEELRSVERDGCGYLFKANPMTPHADPLRVIKLYAVPPAPVSVPDELTREEYRRRFMMEDNFYDTYRGGWNACRSAMLQTGNSTVTTDGYVLVPKEMTPEMMRAVQIKSELGGYAASELSGAYDMFSEFWDVAVSAAPQQEVK
ncbi:hypothetical protein [Citrobacter freundii]|uniref:hypothetical protein n=1 Tax=Citrobacter freundii TaxID=546 RepID=UPI001F2FCD50|nr:hypothetical protein [Citrobacter freundii]